jgi:hypothetical protein
MLLASGVDIVLELQIASRGHVSLLDVRDAFGGRADLA